MPSDEYIRDLESNRIFHSYGYDEGYKDGYAKGYEDSKVLDEIRAEIEKLNPADCGSMFSYESHNGAKYMKDDVLEIIDKYKAESEE
jgi:hypothetical protein